MSKKLLYIAASLAVAAGTLGTATMASASSSGGSFKDGPYASHSPDSGTCGNNWAVDLFNRQFSVALPANPDGSFTVTEKFANGHFITHGSGASPTTPVNSNASPEACGATPTNGTLNAGIVGTMSGTFTVVVAPGANFNSSGSCALDSEGECTTAAWVQGFFGVPSSGYSVTKYSITYNAPSAALAHKWVNADTGDIGDIRST